jgi:uncharacterized protein
VFKEKAKRYYEQFIALKGSPDYIARSFAGGCFVGACPFIGTHSILCMAFSVLFRLNLTALYIATWVVCNPLTGVPLILGEYQLGRIILGWPHMNLRADQWTFSTVFNLGREIVIPLCLGWFIAGAFLAVVFYPASKYFVTGVRKRKAAKVKTAADEIGGDSGKNGK